MSDEQRRPRPAAQYGPTAAAVADNVQRLRKRRELSIYQLSKLLRDAGRPITPAAVGKIERQQRQVNVDDLAALAIIFGVSPGALLLPLNDRPGVRLSVTGAGEVDAADAWDWAEGRRPLKLSDRGEQTEQLEFLVNGVPRIRRILRQHPAGRAVAALQQAVSALIDRSAVQVEDDYEEVHEAAGQARHAASRVAAEIDYIDSENARARNQPSSGGTDG
ncbi:helix-turn-helix domain-containing protein [Streptomyces sp. NPDC055817]